MTFLCIECENLDESNLSKKVKNKCKDCLIKKLKCEVCGKFFTKKWLTSHIAREHQPNNNNNTVIENVNNNNKNLLPEKQKQNGNPSVSTYENHA